MTTKRIPLAMAVLLASLASLAAAQTANPPTAHGRVVALVIGVSRYAKLGGGQQLQFADRDALLIAEALKKAGVAQDNLRVLAAQDATVAAMKSAIGGWLARAAGADDTAIIFFSGHGFFEQEFGEAYLLGADSDAKEPFATALSLEEIKQALARRVRARRVLLITDAVRRDFFDPDTSSAGAAAFLQALDQMATARTGLSVIAASGPSEYSREGQRWNGQGVFAKHLAAALTTGQFIDHNNDGLLTADELIEVLGPLVAADTSNKQHVWHSNTPLGQIALASVPRNAGATPAANPQPPADKPAQIVSKAPVVSPPARDETPAAPKVGGAPVAQKSEPPALIKSPPPADQTVAKAEVAAAPPAAKPSPALAVSRRAPAATPPATSSVTAVETASPPSVITSTNTISTANAPMPPRPTPALPRLGEVAAESPRNVAAVAPASPVLKSPVEAAPSPLILQVEAAIAARNLVEPKNASAWDVYQRLAADPATASEAARLRPVLAEALMAAGRAIVAGQVCSDSIADHVDDFRRAGLMLARARSLKPENAEIGALEKLSAAQALIALQFYDEAERALSQLQAVKLAAIENAMGLVHQGRLDSFRAERAFKRAVEMDPSWAAPHYNLALLYHGQQGDAALTELEQAAALDAKNAAMLVALGDEYFARQQWPRAAESYRKAIAVKPNDDALHTKLGHALYSQGLQAEANREYQKARELRGKP